MFNAPGLTKALTFPKIIGGISKTLQIANQIIPLYQRAKPMIANAKSIIGVMKSMGKNVTKTIEAKSPSTENFKSNINTNTKKAEQTTSPTFFL